MISIFRIGETISVGNIVPSEVATEIETMQAFMVRSAHPVQFVRPDAVTPVELIAAPRAADGDIGPGWNFTLSDEASATLSEGLYGIDWRATLGDGSTDISEQTLLIRLTRSAAA